MPVFTRLPDAMFETANDVVVALVRRVLPVSVVEAIVAERLALSAPPMLVTPEMVVDPLTARAEEVAETKVAPWKPARPVKVAAPKVAPPTALN